VTRLLSVRILPAPLHRWLLRGAHRLRTAWWGWQRPLTSGVSIIARDGEGRVLLIRQSYGSRDWNLPGGGIRSGEDPAVAAAREFEEELGCPVTAVELLTIRDEQLHGATNRVHLFTARLAGDPRPDGREVVAAQLFPLATLPSDLGRGARERLALLSECLPPRS
jgi:8-oxo-dGTP pyrophosphatase MutT (NUDIX family)